MSCLFHTNSRWFISSQYLDVSSGVGSFSWTPKFPCHHGTLACVVPPAHLPARCALRADNRPFDPVRFTRDEQLR